MNHLKINFVGNFNRGYVGELADEVHLARELEFLGHTVTKVPRDQWKAFVDGETPNADWVLPQKADINIICKWDAFNDEKYVDELRKASSGPVFYFVWDFMLNPDLPDWHINMARAADLYLSGERGIFDLYKKEGVRPYYFQMDVCDGNIPTFYNEEKKYDVVFTGSYLGQGDRIEFLRKINAEIPITIFSWNYQEWQKEGFISYPAVYGADYNKLIGQSRIVLGLSVEPHCEGYWSNRVGKVLRAGGFLLQQYAPGMERFGSQEGVLFFSTPEEAIQNIRDFLDKGTIDTRDLYLSSKWTSRRKMQELSILMERFLKEGNGEKWLI